MYLKQIKINGFKSFADKINFELEKGITGIVGPNGSGKSNVVDAVRWVLGEQSVKSLRGDGNMCDVIFSGSKSRKPSNSASVTLVFDNIDHSLKIDFSEVSIKRTIYKSGENEYFINNEKVRLKDILELLLDSGSEKESFSIISQGDISNILSTKPEDRRVIFESAAGVLKYKKRKEEALKKLNKTNDNIDRVNDILNELESRLYPLKEQSEKATKYLNTKKELEEVEISLIINDIDNINKNYNINKNKIDTLNSELIEVSTSNRKLDSTITLKKLDLSKTNELLKEKQNELLFITKEVEKLNGQKNIISERKKYEIDDIKLHNNIMFLKEEHLSYKNKIELLSKEINDILKDLNINKDIKTNCENKLNNLEIDKNKLFSNYNVKNKIITNNEYKINVLENSIDNNNTFSYAVKSVLNNTKLSGIYNAIGNIISTKECYKNAIEIAIGYSASFIITENEKDAENAITYLKNNSLGRVTFFPINTILPKTIDINITNILKDYKGYIDIASNLVNYDTKYKNIISNLLGNIIVVDNMKTANEISKKLNHKYRIVTLDGDLINVGGSLTGGSLKKSSSALLDKMEKDKLLKENEILLNELKNIDKDINDNKNQIESISFKLDSSNRKIIYCNEILNIKNNELTKYKEKLEEIQNNIDGFNNVKNNVLNEEEEKIINSYYESLKNKDILNNDINKLNNEVKDIQDEINVYEHNYKESNSKYYKIQNELKELEIEIGKYDIKLDNLLNTLTVDYNITYEKAKKDYILILSEEEARKKVFEFKKIINDLGQVNLGAIEEYKSVKERYDFLNSQKEDLFKAENTLNDIINEMDQVMKNEFIKTFNLIENEFKNVFKDLFGGGTAYLKLTNPDNMLETGIDIIALPPGKKLSSISLLSGGEKALTAIALLFAILRVNPVPFCILDEVEAPLDEANVDIFGKFIKKMEDKTQFIIITHKKKTMEYANVLYGITMQESGVSKLVSVKLEELNKEYI